MPPVSDPDRSAPLSPLRAALLHTRPRSWPIVAIHMGAGWLVAGGWKGAAPGTAWGGLLVGGLIWAVGLNGGTLALNGAVDRDEGDVGYLDDPPAAPAGLGMFGTGLMLAGAGAAFLAGRAGWIGPAFLPLYSACVFLSLLYSVPPVRLKARPGWDLLVNCAGYGAATFLAGWAVTAAPLSATVGWAAAGFAALFGGLYPLTQIYQMEDDRRAGTETLSLRLGRRPALWFAALCTALAFGLLARAWTALPGASPWTAAALVAAGLVWIGLLVPLLRRGDAGKQAMYGALGAWGITDLAAVLALSFSA